MALFVAKLVIIGWFVQLLTLASFLSGWFVQLLTKHSSIPSMHCKRKIGYSAACTKWLSWLQAKSGMVWKMPHTYVFKNCYCVVDYYGWLSPWASFQFVQMITSSSNGTSLTSYWAWLVMMLNLYISCCCSVTVQLQWLYMVSISPHCNIIDKYLLNKLCNPKRLQHTNVQKMWITHTLTMTSHCDWKNIYPALVVLLYMV